MTSDGRQWLSRDETYSPAREKAEAVHDYSMIWGKGGKLPRHLARFKSRKLDQLFGDALQPAAILRLLELTVRGRVFPSQYDPTPPTPPTPPKRRKVRT